MSTDDLTSGEPPSAPSYRHRTGDLLGAKYRLERRLGAGGMGEVWLATNVALDLPVAIKLLHADAGDPKVASTRSHLLREARAAAAMSHPAIVRVFDFGRTFRGDSYIVMERLHGEDLRDRLMRTSALPQEEAVRLMLPIAGGLHAAHLRGVVHRDLKPENVFLTRDDAGRLLPKIVDFGLADLRWIDDAERVLAGTPDYMAPEQIEGTGECDHHVDTWALCCVLFELLTGRAPFDSPSLAETFERIVAGDPTPLPAHVDAQLARILARGLTPRREDRFRSARDLGETLARWLLARGTFEDITGQSLTSAWFDALGTSTTCDQLPAVASARIIVTPPASGIQPSAGLDTARCDTVADPAAESGRSVHEARDDAPDGAPLRGVALGSTVLVVVAALIGALAVDRASWAAGSDAPSDVAPSISPAGAAPVMRQSGGRGTPGS